MVSNNFENVQSKAEEIAAIEKEKSKIIGDSIFRISVEFGDNIPEFGDKVGVHKTTVYRKIKGEVNPCLKTILKIRSYTNLPIDEILARGVDSSFDESKFVCNNLSFEEAKANFKKSLLMFIKLELGDNDKFECRMNPLIDEDSSYQHTLDKELRYGRKMIKPWQMLWFKEEFAVNIDDWLSGKYIEDNQAKYDAKMKKEAEAKKPIKKTSKETEYKKKEFLKDHCM